MFLILFENNTYVISANNFIDTSKVIQKSLVHFQIKTACSSPYSFSEIHTLNDEFVDSLFVANKWENVNFETSLYIHNDQKCVVFKFDVAEDETFDFNDINFGCPDDDNLFNGGTLYQLPYIHTQMMGYLYKTLNGQLIAIDGGNPSDKENVINAIKQLGGHVHHWFVTHYHDDHTGSIIEALNSPEIKVDNIYYNFPPEDALALYGDSNQEYVAKLIEAVPKETKVITPKKGDVYHLDNLIVTVLNDAYFGESPNWANDTSVCYKFDTGKTKILFPGDLAKKCDDYLKDAFFAKEIKDCQIVQMTHHGNNGATKEFYDAINLERCLWPTPLWLWNNDDGHGKNSFKFTTLTTREWMRERNVKKHYHTFDKKILEIK